MQRFSDGFEDSRHARWIDAQRTSHRAAKKKRGRTRTAAHDDKRLEIMERCADLFDSGGYHRATMQMLADEVGLGKPTLYHYFPSKTDILFAIHQKHIAALIEGLDSEQRRGSSPQQMLIHACRDILEEIAHHPGYVRAFFEHYGELEGSKRTEIRARRAGIFRQDLRHHQIRNRQWHLSQMRCRGDGAGFSGDVQLGLSVVSPHGGEDPPGKACRKPVRHVSAGTQREPLTRGREGFATVNGC